MDILQVADTYEVLLIWYMMSPRTAFLREGLRLQIYPTHGVRNTILTIQYQLKDDKLDRRQRKVALEI